MKKILFLLLSGALLAVNAPLFAGDLPVDLSSLDAYVREGFDPSWTQSGPSEQILTLSSSASKSGALSRLVESGPEKWLWIRGVPGNRTLRIDELGLSGMPKRPLFSLGVKPRTFTFCIPVHFASADTQGHSLGLALPRIGQNWAVYFNGVLLRSEVFLSKEGTILRDRSMRGQTVEIPPSLIRKGQNLLSFKIIGDPTARRTGFYNAAGYTLDRYVRVLNPFAGYLDVLFIGIYFFFGLYHLVLFLWRRSERFNLTFSFSMILIAVYFLTRTPFAYRFFSDTRIIMHVEIVSVILALSVFVIFLERIILDRISRFAAGYFIFSLLCAAVSVVYDKEALLAWEASLGLCFLYVMVFDIFIPLSSEIMAEYRKAPAGSPLRAFTSSAKGLFLSVPGNLSLGVLVLFSSAIIEMATMRAGKEIPLTKYTVFLVVMGIIVLLANRFLRVQSRVEDLNANLEHKVDERTKELRAANDEIAAAMSEVESANATLEDANARLEESRAAAEAEIMMAARVQDNIFPERSPVDDVWDIACAFKPMSGVSGDLYNFHYRDGKISGVSLFDVSGHGLASGLVTLLAHSIVSRRFTEGEHERIHQVMEKINGELVADIGAIDNYLTGILLRFSGFDVEYVNAGHPELLFRKGSTGKVKMVEPKDREYKGSFLGVPGMDHPFATVIFRMERDDVILLYSDCLNESTNAEGKQYGVARIISSLEQVPAGENAHEIMAHVIDDFVGWTGGEKFNDDLTVIIIKRKK